MARRQGPNRYDAIAAAGWLVHTIILAVAPDAFNGIGDAIGVPVTAILDVVA